jgi:hypothetical protein
MHRTFVPLVVAVLLLSLLGLSRPGAIAQEGSPATAAGFVGAWAFTDVGLGLPSLGTFTADGNFILSNLPTEPVFEGADFEILLLSTGHGVWAATDENSADFTFVYLYTNERGEYQSKTTFSGRMELGADGQSLSGEYAFDVRLPDGTVVHANRGAIEGTRISIIPMDELAPTGTSAATPAA